MAILKYTINKTLPGNGLCFILRLNCCSRRYEDLKRSFAAHNSMASLVPSKITGLLLQDGSITGKKSYSSLKNIKTFN